MFGVSGLRIEQLRESGYSRVRVALSYGIWSLIWIASHVMGGSLVGAVLGSFGRLIPLTHPGYAADVLAGCLIIAGLHHLRILHLPMPQMHRQVERSWMLSMPLNLTAIGYGLQLGSGVSTRVTNFLTYVVLAAAVLTHSVEGGALTMAAFGVARSLPAIFVGPFAGNPQRSLALALRVEEWEDRIHRGSGAVFLLAAPLTILVTGAM